MLFMIIDLCVFQFFLNFEKSFPPSKRNEGLKKERLRVMEALQKYYKLKFIIIVYYNEFVSNSILNLSSP